MPDTEEMNSEMSNKSIRELNTKRGSIKGRLTKFKNYLDSLLSAEAVPTLEILKLKSKLSKFEFLFAEFDAVQGQIEILNSSSLDLELSVRDVIEQDFHDCIALAQQLISHHDDDNKSDSSRRTSSSCHHEHEHLSNSPVHCRLPKLIMLPNF